MSSSNVVSSNVAAFDSSVYISEDLNRKLMSVSQDLAIRAIEWCASQYSFDSSDALRMLNLSSGKMESKKQVEKKPKLVVVKPSFPLPYNGEHSPSCCQALRQNNGLYTQCQSNKKNGSEYCKSCDLLASKSQDGIPEYGTIQMRLAIDIQEYVDPKGRKPVSYTKVMKKFKINQEQAIEEAGKFNININPIHFEVAEAETKRGRPKAAKAPKEPKGAKGRPKKARKVLAIEGQEEEDLFASLVANASINSESEAQSEGESEAEEEFEVSINKKASKKKPTDEGKALKKQQEEEARALKKKQEEEAKEAKALKKQQEEEARALKKKQEEEEKAAKALKKKQEEEEKAALKEMERIAKEEEKATKALKKKQEEEAKAAKAAKPSKSEKSGKAAKSSKKEEAEEEDGEPDVVKKIEFEGKKYLKSKKTGIVYDYNEYVQNQEQVVVGKWNESKNKVDFAKVESDSEEEEEEYESDEDRND